MCGGGVCRQRAIPWVLRFCIILSTAGGRADCSHLNWRGAQRYTQAVRAQVEALFPALKGASAD